MSYYLEGRVPLVSDVNAMPLVHALELQASVRRDEYTTKAPSPSSVEVPSRDAPLPDLDYSENKVQANKVTLSARYEPFLGLSVRGSYGTGFLPPSIAQIVQRISPGEVLDFFDPKRGGDAGIITTTPVDRIELGNPDLKPENSKSWSLGVIFAPKVIPGLRLSADYVNIKKTDEITALDFQTIINLEDVLPGRVIRAPLEPNPPPGFTAGVITAINESLINVAATRLEAYDFQADYLLKTSRFGEFRFYAIATLQPRIERRITADTTFINFVNFTGGTSGFGSGVLKWRGNGGITWTKGPLTVAWNAQYFGHYSPCTATASEVDCAAVVLNQGSTRIPSQMYHDLFVRYAFSDNHGSLLNGTELAFGVQNLFDKSPPIIARVTSNGGASNGFSYSTYGDPRLRRFTFSMRKHF
jgi:outer membrane receptor protein involved in Fe transport